MSIISRNGKAYDNGDVVIAILGSIDYEVTKIDYGKKQAHTRNYSLGSNEATSWSKGKIEPSCTLGLRLKSISTLEKAAGGSLLNIKPFDIVVTFTDEENEMITDVVKVKFQEQKRTVDDGDDIKAEFEMFCLDVDFNI
ncbi:MAG: hypothetical protein H6Q15_1762 [Bacteroidetes bacterium]|nr:hypothetical protein [Bacteroidota bacterium]